MNTWSLALAGQITRGWASLYTAGLPVASRQERRNEIASDLWEHASWAGGSGRGAHATAAHIFARTVLGMPSDVSWHVAELGGPEMTFVRKEIVAFAILGVLSVLSAVGLTGGLVSGSWSATDDGLYGFVLLLATFWGLLGPFAAIAGVYVLRRATAEGRDRKLGRTLIVAGTCGIAAIGIAMFWLVLTPIIGVAIIVYWVRRIRVWKSEPAVA